ncbi:VWA domain-containing protein [Niallia oryzisoli]|uniref:VWA domain-containing protein n=1 Tax=Niallia oryzisoli TaxID=1737571 RepID=UPI00373637B2
MDFTSIKNLNRRDRVYKNPTVNADSFDKRQFNSLLNKSKGLQELKSKGDIVFPLYSQLMGDIWSTFYKNQPQLLEEIPEELTSNQAYLQTIMKNEEFEECRKNTRFDEISSALSTISFGNKVLDWIQNQQLEDKNFNKAIHQAFKAQHQQKIIEQQSDRNQSDQQKKEQEKAEQQMKQSMQQLSEQLQKKLNSSSHQLQSMLEDSVAEARESKDNMEKLISGMGQGNGKSELEKVPVKEQFELAEMLQKNPNMKEIADWAGRFKEVARAKQKHLHSNSIERSGLTIGNEVERLLPTELSNLAISQAKVDFIRRFAEGQTMIYDKKGKDTLGKGPIILCLDQSGSMRKLDTQSKGFALAMMSIAKKQKRDFALITFSTSAKVQVFQNGKSTTDDLILLAGSFLGGGTNFYDPLKKSLSLIKESRFKQADIVFVTDGQANLPDDFVEEFKHTKVKMKFECLSVLIGGEADFQTVQKLSNRVISTDDFMTADEAFSI